MTWRAPRSVSGLLCLENSSDSLDQRGQVIFDRTPDNVPVDIKIHMDEPISHPHDLSPWDRGMGVFHLTHHLRGSFADDLQILDQGQK